MMRLSLLLPFCLLAAFLSVFSLASGTEAFLPKPDELSVVEVGLVRKGAVRRKGGRKPASKTESESGAPLADNAAGGEDASENSGNQSGLLSNVKKLGRRLRRAVTGGSGRSVPPSVVDTDDSSGPSTEESTVGEEEEEAAGKGSSRREAPVARHDQKAEQGSSTSSSSPPRRRSLLPKVGFGKGKKSDE